MWRHALALLVGGMFLLGGVDLVQAQSSKKKPAEEESAGAPRDYSSPNFVLHTDMSAEEAKELLTRLETMIKLISAYFGQRLPHPIECYVAKDLKNWPPGSMPSEQGRAQIAAGAGVTITLSNGRVAKSTVYSVADGGTPQHEAVHAYCGQSFGSTGPVWYAEGMAEMGQYWKQGDPSVNCHPVVVEYLRKSAPKSMNEIVNSDERTGDSWENYSWRWALCHLLANNKNYSDRFLPLGQAMMLKKPGASFNQTYGAMASEISFEYLFFLKHFDIGYRADLCAWDWKKKFIKFKGASPLSSTIEAMRGWQPTGAILTEGEEYEYSASGTWKTTKGKDAPSITAGGNDEGAGRLIGVVIKEFDLEGSLDLDDYISPPIELGEHGDFTAPSDGKLYLRCQESWTELADNSGKLSVKLKVKGKGNPLPPPKTAVDKKNKPRSSSKKKTDEATE
ncbi:MAG: hypothetical protein AB7O62_13185 [Pirellulales bacterium]